MKKIVLSTFTITLITSSIIAQNWTTVTPGSTGTATGITMHNNALLISTQAASPHRSTDGNTWTQKNNGLTGVETQGGGVGSAGNYIYYGAKGGNGILRSNDDGNTWSAAGTGITVSATNYGRFFYEFNGAYYCSMSAPVVSNGGLFRSTDGITWNSVTLGGSNGESAYTMAEIGGKLYACTNMDFYESSDNGMSWTAVSTNGAKVYNGLFEHLGRRLIHTTFGMEYSDDNGATWDTLTSAIKSSTYCGFVAGNNDTLYTYSASSGVYYSVDTGATWVDITGDLSSNDVLFMTGMQFFNGNLYLSTLLAVKSNQQGVTSINELDYQNNFGVYPNPFENQVFIENKEKIKATYRLIDVLGKSISVTQSNGAKFEINTENLLKGIYFLQITNTEANSVITTKKIIKN